MNERVNTPFTAEHFVAYCLRMVGHPYWYGTCGYKATSSLLSRKAKQYPSHYGSGRTSRYKQDIANKEVVCDCIGGAKGYAWTGGGQAILDAIGTDMSVPSTYGSHGCPDKGANSMFSYAKSKGCAWGTMASLPEVPGLALTKDGHVGYYIGDGWAVEWQGYSSGCIKTQVSKRPWTHWYALPFIDYGDGIAGAEQPALDVALGSRLLKKGMSGADVKALQELLMQLGYDLTKYGADGKYGSETEAAVLDFQKDQEILQDGKYGSETHAALMDAVADNDEGNCDEPETNPMPETHRPAGTMVVIISEGGKVNIRAGNGTQYARLSSVAPGTTFEHIATATNGWLAVAVGNRVGWVSGSYAQLIRR